MQYFNVSLSPSRRLLSDVMSTSVYLWRVETGIFNFRLFVKLNISKQLNAHGIETSHCFMFSILIILIICGDTEHNSGPKKNKSCNNFSLCHWNLNSIAAHGFSKLSLLEA